MRASSFGPCRMSSELRPAGYIGTLHALNYCSATMGDLPIPSFWVRFFLFFKICDASLEFVSSRSSEFRVERWWLRSRCTRRVFSPKTGELHRAHRSCVPVSGSKMRSSAFGGHSLYALAYGQRPFTEQLLLSRSVRLAAPQAGPAQFLGMLA